MGKLPFLLGLALLMALSGCGKSDAEDPNPFCDDSCPGLEQVVKADFEYLQGLPGEGQMYYPAKPPV